MQEINLYKNTFPTSERTHVISYYKYKPVNVVSGNTPCFV